MFSQSHKTPSWVIDESRPKRWNGRAEVLSSNLGFDSGFPLRKPVFVASYTGVCACIDDFHKYLQGTLLFRPPSRFASIFLLDLALDQHFRYRFFDGCGSSGNCDSSRSSHYPSQGTLLRQQQCSSFIRDSIVECRHACFAFHLKQSSCVSSCSEALSGCL